MLPIYLLDSVLLDENAAYSVAIDAKIKLLGDVVCLVTSKNVDDDALFIGIDFDTSKLGFGDNEANIIKGSARIGFNIDLGFTNKFNDFVENQLKRMFFA